MTELLKAVASWPTLLLVVVVFGFAPGFCLRLIVLAYPRSDPRRAGLLILPHNCAIYNGDEIPSVEATGAELTSRQFDITAEPTLAALRSPELS